MSLTGISRSSAVFRRKPPRRRRVVGLVALTAVGAVALVAGGPADAATPLVPPTVTSSFTPNPIGVGESTGTALSITIANPSPTAKISNIAFSDTLPTGLTIDNPTNETGTCGSTGVAVAVAGTSTFSLTGGSLAAAASCTVSVEVVAAAPGVLSNSPGVVSSSAGSSDVGATETLTVLGAPTVGP